MQLELFSTIKVGDIVKQRPNSTYWGYDEESNPKDMLGTVSKVTPTGAIYVEWKNGRANVYESFDLDIQRQDLPPLPGGCTCERFRLLRNGCCCEGGMAELERERK